MTDTITAPAWARRGTDLSGKTVLVVGEAGGVGEGVVRALLADGATVIATSRTRAKLDDLAARVDDPGLIVRLLDVMSDDLGGPSTGWSVSMASSRRLPQLRVGPRPRARARRLPAGDARAAPGGQEGVGSRRHLRPELRRHTPANRRAARGTSPRPGVVET